MVEIESFGPDAPSETTRETSVVDMSDEQLTSEVEREETEAPVSDPFEAREVEFGEPAQDTEVVDEPADETTETVEAEPVAEEPAEEPAETEEEAQVDTEKEVLRLQLVEEQAERKRLESLVGEHGGRIGHLEGKLKAAETQPPTVPPAQQPVGEDPFGEVPQQQPLPTAAQESTRTDPNTLYLVRRAFADAGNAFSQQHPEIFEVDAEGKSTGRHRQEFVDAIGSAQEKVSGLLESNDPNYVEQATMGLLETAYWKFIKADAQARREALLSKQADQSETFKKTKQAAGVTSSDAPPTPPPKAKTLSDVPTKALDGFLDQHFGGRG